MCVILILYGNGRGLISKILRKKLEAVGINADYIITGKRIGKVTCSEQNKVAILPVCCEDSGDSEEVGGAFILRY